MPKIVFTTWGSLGDLYPFLALALELKQRGHDVSVGSLPSWRSHVENARLAFHPIRPDVPPGENEARETVRRVLDAREGPEFLFRQVLMPHLRDTYDDTLAAVQGADLIVSHQLPVTGPIVAEMTGIRWVSAVLAPLSFFSAYDPPTFANPRWYRPIARLHPVVARAMGQIGRRVSRAWVEPVYRLREQLDMPPAGHPLFEGQHSPHLVLALFSPVLGEKQRDHPPQTLVTGFPFYDAAADHPSDSELIAFLDAGDPPIVFTLGSSAVWVAEDFYRVSLEAVKKTGRRAVLLAGESAASLKPLLPASILAVAYAPHSVVMPRGSLTVHQGGVGTTGQALRAGRPMIVVPFGQDQHDNARRCTELGVARTIERGHYTVDRLARELEAVLTDAAATRTAAAIGEQVRAERGTEMACDGIERVIGGR
jgi:UDP:flavonoid glycosyltransferase YjiC (YdhE family)